MQKDVTQGKSYCLTVYSVPCKVTAIGKDNIEYTLLNVSETGQYLFIAPTWKVNISQDDASIVETFNLAGTGKVGGSGSGSDPTYGLLKIIFVDALPPISEAKENTLYFVPKDGAAPDNYDEYIFDPVNRQFELVGQSAIDTSDFAKLSSTNIFLAPNTFNEIITFKKGLKVSESGPVITSNDTTLNLPNTSTPLLKAQGLILTGVSTFNNEIRVPTIAGLTSTPIKVTSAVDFTSNSDTNFSGNINTPSINITDLITTPSGKIQTNDLGEFTIGLTNSSPTIADNGAHKFAVTDINKTAISLSHKIVKNGIWSRGWVIPTDLWDFTYNGEAELTVKTPTKNNQAANKLYVDTSISAISQFDSSSNQIISGTWEFSKPLKIAEAQLANEAVSKGYVDTNLSSKVDSTDVYTKTEIDNNYATKTEVADIKATANAAAERAESAAQEASNARNDAQNAKKEAEKSAESAATSATSAANSATAAANALAAIPQVDASGNMTLAGGLTAAGAINANGGINIPLAVGAPTDTGAVNRFYTSGLAGAVSALVQPIYLNSSSITVAGSISKASNGTLAGLTQRFSVGAASAGSNAYGSAVIPLIGPNGQFNYSSVCGFSLAVNATAFAKFTFGIGRGSKTNRTGLTMDSYSMIPGNNLAVNYGEIIDVTINTPYDTVRKGYEIRVREIFYVSSVGHWQVKTTTVFLPVGHNELMPNGLNRLIFMQSGPPSIEEREEKAALYMELGGGSTNTLFKIASLRGFINFEAGTGVSTLVIDARNEKTYALSADAGTGTRHLYSNGLTNPTYHALEAMAVNAIESEETADFEDINIPL